MCDLAGIDVPEAVEGKSFRSVLDGRTDRIRDTVYGAYCGGTKPGMRSIKTSDGWKLIEYDVLGGTMRETQLFNLRKNPHELLAQHHNDAVVSLVHNRPTSLQRDLAELPEYKEQREALGKLLKQEMLRLGDPYALSE
jgi:arylsulfatase A-like enzyme